MCAYFPVLFLPQTFQREMMALIVQMGSEAGIPLTLKEYSAWLATFQAANYEQDLPLPGQYTGRAKPMPEYHVKINSFDDRVCSHMVFLSFAYQCCV